VEQVEAGLTRLLAIFSSQVPEKIGPVRSVRISDIDLLANMEKLVLHIAVRNRRCVQLLQRQILWT
ncbi:MAG: DUF3048 domain-containing protein, partial [Actinobacteria bacterium]|nr:DUF3048 domain-containing protein [Actinomycetota bacterium]